MVYQLREETGEDWGTIQWVAGQLGCGVESLRTWVKRGEIDRGERPGVTSADAAQIKELRQDGRELRRANEILKRASAFFAAELDRPPMGVGAGVGGCIVESIRWGWGWVLAVSGCPRRRLFRSHRYAAVGARTTSLGAQEAVVTSTCG